VFWLGLALICATARSQDNSTDIRTVDFKSFTYPWMHPSGWPDRLQWMSLRLQKHVRLINGKWDERDETEKNENATFSGLTLEEVQYARLSSAATDDAVAVLRYDSGGTQNHYWVYVYGSSNNEPKLLGFFHAGDRGYYGLSRVFIKDRVLHVVLFDPRFERGDCCSDGDLDFRFRWNGKGFESAGAPIPERAASSSRRAVSVFGLPNPD
jgi:hypothetical protein